MLVLYIFSRVQHTVILVHMPRANKKPNLSACSQNTLQLQTSWVSSINAKLRCQSSYLVYVVPYHCLLGAVVADLLFVHVSAVFLHVAASMLDILVTY